MESLAAHHSVCAVVGNGPDDGPFEARLKRALDGAAAWIWVRDGSTAPRPDALAALLDAVDRAAGLPEPAPRFSAPVVMAGVVVDAEGRVDEARGAWYRRNHIDLTMGSSGERLLPIRAAAGPVLVHRSAAASAPAPASASPPAILEWTAWILRDAVGYLVPDSESVALEPAADPLGDPRTVGRLIRGGALRRLDVARAAHELVERRGGRLRAPAGGIRPAPR